MHLLFFLNGTSTQAKLLLWFTQNRVSAPSCQEESAVSYIAPHVLKHEIQVSDPQFECFIAVSRSGVAAGWAAPGNQLKVSRNVTPNPSIERTSPGKPGAASHVKR
jgi:hypothetical protein